MRTTAPGAGPGTICRMITHAAAPIAGARTASRGFSDDHQYLCLSLALWNGKDPILKERLFGLTELRRQPRRRRQGAVLLPRRHAEPLVPEDALQVSAGRLPLLRSFWRKTAGAAPNRRSSSSWTRAFSMTIATSTCSSSMPKAAPDEILMQITAHNRGPDAAALVLLPQLCCRNTWSWRADAAKAGLGRRGTAGVEIQHPELGDFRLDVRMPQRHCCSATTRPIPAGCSAWTRSSGYFKDAFHEYLVQGKHDAVNPSTERHQGRRAVSARTLQPAARRRCACACLRSQRATPRSRSFAEFDAIFDARRREADEFYAELQRRI